MKSSLLLIADVTNYFELEGGAGKDKVRHILQVNNFTGPILIANKMSNKTDIIRLLIYEGLDVR